jgi:hypothetical protein
VAQVIADAKTYGGTPPTAVLFAERDLWRWADELHHTNQPATVRASNRFAAVILLVELPNGPRDLGWLADTIIHTTGTHGDGWTIRHRSAYPDFGAAFTDPDALLTSSDQATGNGNGTRKRGGGAR